MRIRAMAAVMIGALVIATVPQPVVAQEAPPSGIVIPDSVLTTTTTTAPPSTTTVDGDQAPGSPGMFDVAGKVRSAIDGWFRDLVTSALTSTFDLLGRTLFSTPQVAGFSRVKELWGTSLGIANALLVLFLLAGGAVVMGYETVQVRYSIKEVLPRLVFAAIAANASLAIITTCIELANSLSMALVTDGTDATTTVTNFRSYAMTAATRGMFMLCIAGTVAVIALLVIATYVARIAITVVLVAAAPLMLVAHALPQTEGVARFWWRAMIGCLGVQLAQTFVLVTAVRVFFAPDGNSILGIDVTGSLIDLVVIACLMWVLLRIPIWVSRMVFTSHHRSAVMQVVRTYVMVTRGGH